MTLDDAVAALIENAEEWRSGRDAKQAVDVVRAACDVLVAGHDGPAMATLAEWSIQTPRTKCPTSSPTPSRKSACPSSSRAATPSRRPGSLAQDLILDAELLDIAALKESSSRSCAITN
jgi:hypothetical protein